MILFADLIWILKVSRCDELLGAWIRIAADIFRIYEPWIQLPTEEDVRKFMLLHVIPDAADSQDTSKYRGSILGAICVCIWPTPPRYSGSLCRRMLRIHT